MDNWKSRFEELLFEVEGLESPTITRNDEYRKILRAQLWDELCILVATRNANLLSDKQYLDKLSRLHENMKKAKKAEIDFNEK
jgi:hypothetical protein